MYNRSPNPCSLYSRRLSSLSDRPLAIRTKR
ncbi:unnamed protein product [Cylicostephanus goldi]|uniref:Uncharacterized protein n=1 Tax=Cylicostephanus goldi TaxID=71465 RepID=A0A3P6S055_CYLGO|nr:unnamed protein product [Cylicostephanus goldi]